MEARKQETGNSMIIDILKHTMMITGFVLMMMLLIEYINVQTRGEWQTSLKKSRFRQYILGAFLGARCRAKNQQLQKVCA